MHNCETCGTKFKGKSGKSNRFCSLPCYHKYMKGTKRLDRRIERVEKTCLACGNRFERRITENQKYCSFRCYRDSHRSPDKGTKAICVNCGKEYIKHITGQTTCSRECSVENLLKHNDADFLKERQCRGCGTVFKPRNRYSTYCSKACYDGYRNELRTTRCEYCNKTFKRNNAKRRFCSEVCAKEYMVGENNPTYKGYVTTNNGYLRYSDGHPKHPGEYVHRIEWLKHNTLDKCNRCDNPVDHVHHIDRDKTNNDIDNLEGLCYSCHLGEHAEDSQFWIYRKNLST